MDNLMGTGSAHSSKFWRETSGLQTGNATAGKDHGMHRFPQEKVTEVDKEALSAHSLQPR